MNNKCKNCSAHLRENINFCTKCGSKIEDQTSVKGFKRRRKVYIPIVASVLVLVLVIGSIYVVNQYKDKDMNASRRITDQEGDKDNEGNEIANSLDAEFVSDTDFTITIPDKAIIKEGKVIAEGIIYPEDAKLRADDERVAMSFDSLCINEPMEGKISEVTIENPPVDTVLNIYEFQMESMEELEGIVTLEVPYDAGGIPSGMTAAECVSGVYYHEDLHEWVKETFTIDEERAVVLITTTHLSLHGTKISITPLVESLDEYIIRVANGTPYERAISQKPESIVNRLSQEEMEKILNELKTYGAGEPTQILNDASLKFLGDGGSFSGIGNEFLQLSPYSKSIYDKMSKRIGNFAGGLVLIQLISDMYFEKPAGEIYFNTAKGLTFWQGAAIGTALGGPVGGTVATIVLAGMFLLDVSGIAPIDIPLYIEETNHRCVVEAYDAYYIEKGRTDEQWMKVVQVLVQDTASEGLTGDEFNKRYIQLLKESVTDYTEQFFHEDKGEIVKYMEVAFGKTQGYLGSYSRVYSETDNQRNTKYIEEYIDEILEGEYSGITTSLIDELQVKYKKGLMEKTIPKIMEMRVEYQYLKQLDYLRVTLLELCQLLSTTFYIEFVDRSVVAGETSKYENYYVAPIIKENLVEYQPEKWIVQLNSEGEGNLNMTMLAHYRAKYFTEFGLYTEDDYEGIVNGTATPVKTLPLGLISKNNLYINISGDDADILIEGARFTAIEVIGGGYVEHSVSAFSEYDRECYILWDFGDGDELKEEGNTSTVNHDFIEEGSYYITASLYDESDTKLATDSVTINIEYVEESSVISPNEEPETLIPLEPDSVEEATDLTPYSSGESIEGELNNANYLFFMKYLVSGGQIDLDLSVETDWTITLTGTVHKGEVVTIMIEGNSPAQDSSNTVMLGGFMIAVVETSPRVDTTKDFESSERINLEAGESGSVTATYIIPNNVTHVSLGGGVERKWSNMNGGFSRTYNITVELDVID